MTQPAPSFIETRHGRFGYLAAGELADENAPLVLCLHGFPDHPRSFLPMMRHLARAGYRVVAPYMRGYAPSVLEGPYHAEQVGADAIALADAIAEEWGGDESCALVGHDWGAAATYAALQQAPSRFRRAVTMAVPHPQAFITALRKQPAQVARSWYMLFFQLPFLPEHAVRRRDFRLIRSMWRNWSPGYTLPEESWQSLRACLAASLPAPLGYYRALMQPAGEALMRMRESASWPLITTPTLHLQGADDGCIAPSACRDQERYFAGEFASEVILDVGHFMQLEAPELVASHIEDWLS